MLLPEDYPVQFLEIDLLSTECQLHHARVNSRRLQNPYLLHSFWNYKTYLDLHETSWVILDLDSRSSNKTLATKVLVSGSHRSILVLDILHSTEENDPRVH